MRSRPGGTPSPSDRARQDSRGLGSRRVRFTAFAIAVAVHVIAVLLYPVVAFIFRPDAVEFTTTTDPTTVQGSIVLRLIDIEERPDAERPEDPDEIEQLASPEADAVAPVLEDVLLGELVPPALSAAERLRPNLSEARLWAEPPPEFFELTFEQREELLLSSRIVEWYDSVAIARAAEERFTDWTFRDSNGGRWGISDGQIHLGSITLPLPINFGAPVGKRDEYAQRVFEFEEIQRQSQRYLIETSWKERAAAIRVRRDKERAAARPDTTRSR